MSSFNAAILSGGAQFISRIPPMKRILCLCPVRVDGDRDVSCSQNSAPVINGGHERYRYSIGISVSDPYLAYATPVDAASTSFLFETNEECVGSGIGSDGKLSEESLGALKWDGIPPSWEELLKVTGYRDIGALALALPMRMESCSSDGEPRQQVVVAHANEEHSKFRSVRESVRRTLMLSADAEDRPSGVLSSRAALHLQCFLDDRLTFKEARKMADHQPEMWEDVRIDDDSFRSTGRLVVPSPSDQAAVSLNAFLWRHTGGWQNTFG